LEGLELESFVRKKVRDKMAELHLLERMVKDIKILLSTNDTDEEAVNAVYLWDDKEGQVENGVSY